jgi:predicted transcriptional regulator
VYAERAYLTRLHPLHAHAGAHVARSAAQRGLDALLVVSNENVSGALQTVRDTGAAAGPAVKVVVHEM